MSGAPIINSPSPGHSQTEEDLLLSGFNTTGLPPQPNNTPLTDLLKLIDTYIDEADKYKTNSPNGPIALINVTSYVQLPIILDMLEKSPDSLRLTFPTPADTDPNKAAIVAEQKAIHQLLSERHSKTLGDIVKDSMALIETSHVFVGHNDADKSTALSVLATKAAPSDTSTTALQVAQIFKASGNPSDLQDQFVQGLQAVTSTKVGVIFELPADSQTVLEAQTQAKQITPPTASMPIKVWIGTPAVITEAQLLTNPPPPNFQELEYEQFLKASKRDLDTLVRQHPKAPTDEVAPSMIQRFLYSISNDGPLFRRFFHSAP